MTIDALSAVVGFAFTTAGLAALVKVQAAQIRRLEGAVRSDTRRHDMVAQILLRYADRLDLSQEDRNFLYEHLTRNLPRVSGEHLGP